MLAVNQGEPLFSVYSPALLATQEEYIIAKKGTRNQLKGTFGEEYSRTNQKLLESVRQRLELWAIRKTPIDALPDLSDTQVIIFTEWMGRSPNLIEDQITYPLVTTFLGAPKVKLVRGFTMFGMSFVYVIFEDGTDIYWARSRTLEYLSKLQGRLPLGVTPQMGPDATGVGWVFEYALVTDGKGTPILIKDIAHVHMSPFLSI